MSRRVSGVLLNLPRDITPVNLEELRRVKQALVELESKADNLRCAANSMCTHSLVHHGQDPARMHSTILQCTGLPTIDALHDFWICLIAIA